jgi:heme A synthase
MNVQQQSGPGGPWAARLAVAGAALTVLLIAVGGLVTNTDSGLACPDWPTCFGTPFPRLVGGVLMEHGHRYLATALGVICTLLVALLARGAPRLVATLFSMPVTLGAAGWAGYAKHKLGAVPPLAMPLVLVGLAAGLWALWRLRGTARLAQLALLLVIGQGLLGGLTVIYLLPVTVLVLHTGTSMLVLSALVWLAATLSAAPAAARPPRTGRIALATAAVYLQILLGAAVRHTGAGLICTDLPWCKGALWPTGVHPAVHLHMVHRTFAFAALILVLLAALDLRRAALGAGERGRARLVLLLPALLLLQIGLGLATIWTLKELWLVTAHLLVAALLLSGCVLLWALQRRRGALTEPGAAPGPSSLTGRAA